jgi:integrase
MSLIEEYVENIQYCRTFILDGVAATLSSGTSYEPGVKKNGAMVYRWLIYIAVYCGIRSAESLSVSLETSRFWLKIKIASSSSRRVLLIPSVAVQADTKAFPVHYLIPKLCDSSRSGTE